MKSFGSFGTLERLGAAEGKLTHHTDPMGRVYVYTTIHVGKLYHIYMDPMGNVTG